MISRQRLKKTPSVARLLLAAAMLLQLLCFPVHTAHAAETDETEILGGETTISSVAITWGNMAFEYTDSGDGTGSWGPIDADGDLITVTNLSTTATMRATIRYNPATNTPGILNITANLVKIRANPNSQTDTLYPLHNLAAKAAKLDVSPDSMNLNSDEYSTISARLELTGAPTEALNYTPLGTITIAISKPLTEISTWGHKHADETDPLAAVHIYWVIMVEGCANSRIPGSTLTNELLPPADSLMGTHIYSSTDIADGITVGASQQDANGQTLAWYQWTVYDDPDDPTDGNALHWDFKTNTNKPSWSYTFPTTVPGTSIPLGNKGWTYYIDFTTTTARKSETEGIIGYMNRATITEVNPENPSTTISDYIEGWVSIEHSEAHGNIVPFGTINNGYYEWDIKAIIPGLEVIGKDSANNPIYGEAKYLWYIMDYLQVYDGYTHKGYIENDLGVKTLTNVTVSYLKTEGQITTEVKDKKVPHISEATASDFCAWNNHWASEVTVNGTKIAYGKHVDILCRCYCTASTCPFWTQDGCSTIYHDDPTFFLIRSIYESP